MKRGWKIAGAAIVLVLVILIALPFLIDANQFRPMLQAKLTQALGRDVKVGNLKLALLSGGVTADDLSVADDPAFSHSPFVQAKSLHIGVDMTDLIFSRKVVVTSLTIAEPQISLLQAPSGDWNFSSLGTKEAKSTTPASAAAGSSSKLDLSVKLVKLTDGRFTMARNFGHLKPLVLEKVNAELHDFSPASNFPFAVSMTVAGGGTIQLDGKAGPIDSNDVMLTPATLKLKVDKLDLARSGVNEMAPQVAGLVSFDGSGQTNGSGVDVRGRLKLDQWKLSAKGTTAKRNLELDFRVAHDMKKRAGTVHQADVHMGSAVARITGTYLPDGDTMSVNMNLVGNGMPVEELSAMLPAMAIVLPAGTSLQGGTADLKASMKGPIDRLVTTGTVSLNHTKLTGFNLSSRLSSIEKLAGIRAAPDTDIEVFGGSFRMAPEGMSTDDIKLVLPAVGSLAGGGTVSPDNALSFKMQAAVHTGGIAAFMNNEPVPFTVEGTCSQPVFRPDIGAVVKNEIKGVGKAAEGLLKGLFGGKK